MEKKPTGSKDPYALRRAALGIVSIILENDLRIPLRKVIAVGYELFNLKSIENSEEKETIDDLMLFFIERLKVQLRGKGRSF